MNAMQRGDHTGERACTGHGQRGALCVREAW
jgi:hypothetical protein